MEGSNVISSRVIEYCKGVAVVGYNSVAHQICRVNFFLFIIKMKKNTLNVEGFDGYSV